MSMLLSHSVTDSSTAAAVAHRHHLRRRPSHRPTPLTPYTPQHDLNASGPYMDAARPDAPAPRPWIARLLQRVGAKHVECSYSSTLLFVWFMLLSVRVQCLTKAILSLFLCAVALPRSHGESRLLMPLLFLAELCLYSTRQQPRTPLYFYASVLCALATCTSRPPRARVWVGQLRRWLSLVRTSSRRVRVLCVCVLVLGVAAGAASQLPPDSGRKMLSSWLGGSAHESPTHPATEAATTNHHRRPVRGGVAAWQTHHIGFTSSHGWELCGAWLFVLVGYVCYWQLHPLLTENEAVLVSSWVGFIFCDICVSRDLRAEGGRVLGVWESKVGLAKATSRTHVAGRAMMIYTVMLMYVLSTASSWCRKLTIVNSKSSSRRLSQTRMTIVFVVAFAVLGVATERVVSFHFRQDALMWLYDYLARSAFRCRMLAGWLVGIPLIIVVGDYISRGVRKTVRRKFFHLIAVVAFTPAALYDPPFLAFALMTATSLSAMVELGRHFNVYGAQMVTYFTSQYIDDRDSIDGVVRTHIYLIFGLGVSICIHNRFHEAALVGLGASSATGTAAPGGLNLTLDGRTLALALAASPTLRLLELCVNLIPGIVSLGVVDSSAAIIGSTFFLSYRRVLGRYLKNAIFTERANVCITHKTTTGTAGGLVFGVIFWLIILLMYSVPITILALSTFSLIAVCTLTECFMDGVDNLQMPLVTLTAVYSLFALLL